MRVLFAALMALFLCSCQQSARVGAIPDETVKAPDQGTLHRTPVLTELSWIAASADKAGAFTDQPGECLRAATDKETEYLIEVGRAAFASPFLFGGQAARRGLSCQSCHINGHDNPDFFIVGLSGAPGTADVTSSVFSQTREDHISNPVRIPSLVGIAEKPSFGTNTPAANIHAFVSGAVTEEFQGAPPPAAIIDGIAAYVSHLDPALCPAIPVTRTVVSDMAAVERTLAVAMTALESGDTPTGDFLIVSARAALGRIHERYAAPALEPQRVQLRAISGALGVIRAKVPEDSRTAGDMIGKLTKTLPGLTQDLHAHRRRSLYDVGVLRAALDAAKQ